MLYDNLMNPAFAGMKADSGEDRVESFPVGATPIPFGTVVGTNAQGGLVPGPGTKVRGIAIHSHACGAQYVQYDCASVMRRGLVWARLTASGAATADGPVSYAADGTVGNAGANVLPNASFRKSPTGTVTITTPEGVLALVELHDPMYVAPAA